MSFLIAVIAAQGDVEEHVLMARMALKELGMEGSVVATIDKKEVAKSDAIILPGGESTTISKLIHAKSIAEEIKKAAKEGKPVMGTCAGSILLAKHGDKQIERTNTELLKLMDIWVKRNAFGRQRESFQAKLNVKHVGEFEAVFIRAPAIMKVDSNVDILAKIDDYIVAAQQDNLLAITFHPELTNDTRLHKYFISLF